MNITDVDDKTIKKAIKENLKLDQITKSILPGFQRF